MFLFYEPVDLYSLVRHAPCLKLGGCNGRQLHIYQKDPLIWSGRIIQDSTTLPQLRNVNLERRGSVTVALTCARTLVFPNVTWLQGMVTLWFTNDTIIPLKLGSTWQDPQSEPKLTDKSLVSIHPLPSSLRPSHNALKVISAWAN